MVLVRKGKIGEMEAITNVANASFVPVRYQGFDFRNRMPKIYAANKDYSDIHFIVEDGSKIKAVAGNLLKTLVLNDKEYCYSIVGTVSTLPEESNKGYMALMMKEIDKENIEKGIVFSMLTGKRQRYIHHGYDRSGSRIIYDITSHYYKHNNVEGNVYIRNYEERDLDIVYEIYKSNQPIIVRNKEEFIIDLRISNSSIYTIVDDGKVVGYFAIEDSFNAIHEISIADLKKLPIVMKSILELLHKDRIEVICNSLNVALQEALDEITENRLIVEEIMWKIYRVIPFIEMCLELNKRIKNFDTTSEVYKVDDEIIKISVNNDSYKVEKTNEPYIKEFTKMEFVRYALGNTSSINRKSKIFPLELDFNEGDMF